MTIRVALRSLSARPVRSAVLACGFGFGIGVMAGLLGIGEVIVEQARAPELEGGGDVIVTSSSGEVTSARFVLSSVLGQEPLAGRVIRIRFSRVPASQIPAGRDERVEWLDNAWLGMDGWIGAQMESLAVAP